LGAEQDFDRLYRDNAQRLWAYAYRVSRNTQDADDIVQETFLRLWRSDRGRLDDEAGRRYAFRIASNLLVDRWRDHARLRSWIDRFWGGDAADVAEPSGRAESIDVRELFWRLSRRDRALLWLAYVEGLNHAEIAEALRLATPSVKVMLFRARSRLRALLDMPTMQTVARELERS
jgi:RNA polymerase sigma-70 factor (ECF subfamily)